MLKGMLHTSKKGGGCESVGLNGNEKGRVGGGAPIWDEA